MAKRASEPEWDELYAAPVDAFVARRSELVKKLEGRGEKEQAAALGKARRPPLSAWAVNQAVRADAKALAGLFEAGARMRQAQGALMSGGDPHAFREASEALHAAVRGLTEAAGKIAAEAGHPVSASFLGRLERTFFTGATSEGEPREQLELGRLTGDLNPPDPLAHGDLAGALTASVAAPVKPAARAAAAKKEDSSARRALEREAAELESQAAALEKESTQAAKRADHLDAKAREAEAEAREASERAQAARWAAGEARSVANAAQSRAQKAGLDAVHARAKASGPV